MLTLVVSYTFPAARLAEAEEHLRDLVRHSRDEPGCRRYDVVRSTEARNEFAIVECYDDEAALEAHRATEHFERAGLGGLRALAEHREARTYADFT